MIMAGRRVSRTALRPRGILFSLRHGLRWGDLPQALGYGSGVTCWRRLRLWQELGIWTMLHQVVLNWLGDVDGIDWSRASVDSICVRAKRGGEHTGQSPVDRGKKAASTTAWWIGRGSRARPSSPAPTCTIQSC